MASLPSLSTVFGSIAAFFVVFLVFFYGVGLLLEGIGLALFSAIMVAIINYYVNNYLKPKVRFEVSKFEIVPREFGNFRGFQIKLRFKNEGKRIGEKPTLTPLVNREGYAAQYLRVEIHSENGRKTFKSDPVINTGSFPWRWDSDAMLPGLAPWEKMRKGDEAQITFPEESRPPFFIGTVGPSSGSSHGIQYENIVEFKPGKYRVSVEIKGEDPEEHTTVTMPWKKGIDLTKRDTYAKYWLSAG
jgi:hypothetical protein